MAGQPRTHRNFITLGSWGGVVVYTSSFRHALEFFTHLLSSQTQTAWFASVRVCTFALEHVLQVSLYQENIAV